mmetsp:Transcript_537/g.1114  ORF Transcript_537/g.1114 Transcript_537/m.1114 type:complete len:87 (+) Transcript_537:796-1056(+)
MARWIPAANGFVLTMDSVVEVRDSGDFDHPPTLAKHVPMIADSKNRSRDHNDIEQRLDLRFIVIFVVWVFFLKADLWKFECDARKV